MQDWVVLSVRVLARNKKELWYANRLSASYVTDRNGLKTGEKRQAYSEPVKVKMSMAISSGANNLGSQGIATLEPYGIVTGYTARAVTEDMNCPMEEQSKVWYQAEPTKEVDGKIVPVPHNYVVVRKAKSLNHLIYYLKEVDVS